MATKKTKRAAQAASPSTIPALVVPGLITDEQTKAIDALTKEQRAQIDKELDYVAHILTDFPQSADGERTFRSGGCPCGGCYKCDEQMTDAVTAFAAVMAKWGYDVIRWHCTGMDRAHMLPLLLTIYLNLSPAKQKAVAAEGTRAFSRNAKREMEDLKDFHASLQKATIVKDDPAANLYGGPFRIVDANDEDVIADDDDGYETEEAAAQQLAAVREDVAKRLEKAQAATAA